VLPQDSNAILRGYEAEQPRRSWIVKPYKQGGGKGITVLDSWDELRAIAEEGRKVVVQPYLSRPHLLGGGRKWDLRTYVLLSGVTPVVRAYLYRDGLVRLATEVYDEHAKHGGNKTQFLTNTSVNKRKISSMASLTWSFARLEEELGSKTFQVLLSRIKRVIGMTLVASERAFRNFYRANVGSYFTCANCFHLLGVDLIVDAHFVPRVIEVNGEPSMQLSGESQSHYDATKNAMQQEVARIVLNPLTRLPHKLVSDMVRAGLSQRDIDWIVDQKDAMLYLLKLKREVSQLEMFEPVYPDRDGCSSKARRKIWSEFLKHLLRDQPDNDFRVRLHSILERIICAMVS
jgi:hypothetical protein